jgi:hypothetical protein
MKRISMRWLRHYCGELPKKVNFMLYKNRKELTKSVIRTGEARGEVRRAERGFIKKIPKLLKFFSDRGDTEEVDINISKNMSQNENSMISHFTVTATEQQCTRQETDDNK